MHRKSRLHRIVAFALMGLTLVSNFEAVAGLVREGADASGHQHDEANSATLIESPDQPVPALHHHADGEVPHRDGGDHPNGTAGDHCTHAHSVAVLTRHEFTVLPSESAVVQVERGFSTQSFSRTLKRPPRIA